MDRSVLLAIVLGFAVVLFALMALGWRARGRRQSDIPAPKAVPADRGAEFGSFAGQYVATTIADEPLNRVTVHGLGFRGRVVVVPSEQGLLLRIVGSPEVWIARNAIRGIRRTTWTIDRIVERDGLHLVAWSLGDRDVDTVLRLDDPTAFDAAAQRITERQNS